MLGAIDEGFKIEESSSGSDNDKGSKYIPADTNSQVSRSSRAFLEEKKSDMVNPYLNIDKNPKGIMKSKTLLNNDKKRGSA